jgi:hypothetical protein
LYARTADLSDGWRKYLPSDPTSPWWYTEETLSTLLHAHLARVRGGAGDLPVKEFVKDFRGLARSAAAAKVCRLLPGLERITDFDDRPDAIGKLLGAMRTVAKKPSHKVMGAVGEGHFRERFEEWYGVEKLWYKAEAIETPEGIPYVIEAAVAETECPGELFYGVNFSPTFSDPLAGTWLAGPEFGSSGADGFLERACVSPSNGSCTAAAVHIISPATTFLDRGKTKLKITPTVARRIGEVLWRCSRTLYRQEQSRQRDAARQRRREAAREEKKPAECKLRDAVDAVLPQAMATASGDGRYPVSARTLFYHVRPLIQGLASRELEYGYFSQDLLPGYQRRRGVLDGLYYDPRGVLYEPHTGREIPLGTREVERYVFPSWLYDKILFVEKKGLWPILKAARLAERYDMAVVAAEGYATEAARILFAKAEKGQKYQLAVLHDADPDGYNIARTLQEETERMPGHSVKVFDLGLHLEEALTMGLQTETFTRKKALPKNLDLNAVEKEYFEGELVKSEWNNRRRWVGRRVELNTLSAPDLVRLIERRLEAAGIHGKVIPPDDVLAGEADQALVNVVSGLVKDFVDRLVPEDDQRRIVDRLAEGIKGELPRATREALTRDRVQPWRQALRTSVGSLIDDKLPDVEAEVESMVRDAIANLPEE